MIEDWQTKGIFHPATQIKNKNRNKYRPKGMWKVIRRIVPKKSSVVDIGASSGVLVRILRKKIPKLKVMGLDGTPGIAEISKGLVQECDILNPDEKWHGAFGWGIFTNVGEHVPRRLEMQLIEGVCKIPKRGLIVAWADLETPDFAPKNKRQDYYIANLFGMFGWHVHHNITEKAREMIGNRTRMNKRLLILYKRKV